MNQQAVNREKDAKAYLASFSSSFKEYLPGKKGISAKVSFLCKCGKSETREVQKLFSREGYCRHCLNEAMYAAKRITVPEVITLLSKDGAGLINLRTENLRTHVTFSCRCGAQVTRVWSDMCREGHTSICPECYKASYIPWGGKPSPMLGVKGPAHPKWNPLLTEEDRIRPYLWEDRMWERAILARDDYTCQISGQKGVKLSAHHIWSRRYPNMRFSLENGITLAREIHIKFHASLGGFNKPFTAQELVAFALAEYGKQLELPIPISTYQLT